VASPTKSVCIAGLAAGLMLVGPAARSEQNEAASPQAAASVLPAGFQEEKLLLPGTKLHHVWGGSGPAVILLHGFPEDWSAWRRVAPRLADRFTVIAPDLRGLGRSKATADAFDPATMAHDIAALMAARSVSEAYLVGHDIGGPVAYAFARLYPDRVRGLMLVESPLEGMPSWTAARSSPLMWHLGFHQTSDLPEHLLAGREAIYVRHFLKESAGGKEPDEADVARYAAAYRAPKRLKALLEIYRQLPAQEAFNLAHREPTEIPMTFVGGERVFGKLSEAIAKDLRAWGWSNVESVVVPDAGHYIADEQPEALAALIEARAGRNVTREATK
jgi:pimeloyl-ACP methyl ester carboxylesterase